jgi:peptide/nickel transport system permease protein
MVAAGQKAGALATRKRTSLAVDALKRLLKEKPLGTIGGVIVLIALVVGIFANVLAPYDMAAMHMVDRLQPPSARYLLGTDPLGRDLLSRIIFGARVSMIVGIVGSVLEVIVATAIGTVSGFFGGKLDITVQRLVDAFMCFPPLFLILTVMGLLGQGLWQVIFVLGVSGGIRSSRVVRSTVIGIKENVYISASNAIGSSGGHTLWQHIVPNILPPIIVLFTIAMGGLILAEATVSFLGFGIPPPQPSWGGMLSAEGRRYMLQAPWMAIWPGLALATVVWGINMLGDAVRDILDPRLRGGVGGYRLKESRKRRILARHRAG